MKKLSAFALLAVASAAASAQSSVTVFGIVDLAARHVKNGDNDGNLLSSAGLASNRLGFRGVEDLGGGLSAGFWLEAAIGPDVGSAGSGSRFFDRRSTASLMGGFGEVRLGRDKVPTYTGVEDFDIFGTAGVGTADRYLSTLGSNADTTKRSDNLIAYFLPKSLGGLYGSLALAAPEGTAGKKYAGGRIGYAAGPLNVSATYGQTDVTPVAGDDTYTVGNVGAAFNFGFLKLSGYYNEMKIGPRKFEVINVGVGVPVGKGTLRTSYTRAAFEGGPTGFSDDDKTDQFALGYVYDFSRRTAVYATAARINNKNNSRFVVDSAAALALPNPNTGRDSMGYEVGIRHSF